MTKRLGMRLMLPALALGISIAWALSGVGCNAEPTQIAAPTAPTSTTSAPDTGGTSGGPGPQNVAATRSTESQIANLLPASQAEILAARLARRLQAEYGDSWRDILTAARSIAESKGRTAVVEIADVALDEVVIQRVLETVPAASSQQITNRESRSRERWNELRARISTEGRGPVPLGWDEMRSGKTAEQRGALLLRALRDASGTQNSAALFSSPGGGSVFLVAGMPLQSVQWCRDYCQEAATEYLHFGTTFAWIGSTIVTLTKATLTASALTTMRIALKTR